MIPFRCRCDGEEERELRLSRLSEFGQKLLTRKIFFIVSPPPTSFVLIKVDNAEEKGLRKRDTTESWEWVMMARNSKLDIFGLVSSHSIVPESPLSHSLAIN
jgi:hypothetical protein